MRLSYTLISVLIVAFIVSIGCSGTNAEITYPANPAFERNGSSPHQCWGIYQFIVDAETESIDIVQVRTGDMHLNALMHLEPPPNSNLRVENIQFNGTIIDVDVSLRHPFLGIIPHNLLT